MFLYSHVRRTSVSWLPRLRTHSRSVGCQEPSLGCQKSHISSAERDRTGVVPISAFLSWGPRRETVPHEAPGVSAWHAVCVRACVRVYVRVCSPRRGPNAVSVTFSLCSTRGQTGATNNPPFPGVPLFSKVVGSLELRARNTHTGTLELPAGSVLPEWPFQKSAPSLCQLSAPSRPSPSFLQTFSFS